MEQPESPPRPFPPRSPEFRRDPFRDDRFSRMYYNDDSLRNNAASPSANADDPKSCFIAATTFAFFGKFLASRLVVELHAVRFSDFFE